MRRRQNSWHQREGSLSPSSVQAASNHHLNRMDAHLCSVCHVPAVVREQRPDGKQRWLCQDHLPEEAREAFDTLKKLGWNGEPTGY